MTWNETDCLKFFSDARTRRLLCPFLARNLGEFRGGVPCHTYNDEPAVRFRSGCATVSGAARAIGAVVARFVHTEEVTGSNPVSPTPPPHHRLTSTVARPGRPFVVPGSAKPARVPACAVDTIEPSERPPAVRRGLPTVQRSAAPCPTSMSPS